MIIHFSKFWLTFASYHSKRFSGFRRLLGDDGLNSEWMLPSAEGLTGRSLLQFMYALFFIL